MTADLGQRLRKNAAEWDRWYRDSHYNTEAALLREAADAIDAMREEKHLMREQGQMQALRIKDLTAERDEARVTQQRDHTDGTEAMAKVGALTARLAAAEAERDTKDLALKTAMVLLDEMEAKRDELQRIWKKEAKFANDTIAWLNEHLAAVELVVEAARRLRREIHGATPDYLNDALAGLPEAYSSKQDTSFAWADEDFPASADAQVTPAVTLRSDPTTQSERNEPILPAGGGSSTKHTRWSDVKAKRGTSTDHVVPAETTDLKAAAPDPATGTWEYDPDYDNPRNPDLDDAR